MKNGHILLTVKTCKCDKQSDYPCPVCDGGLAVCSLCGKAEIELDQPCTSNAHADGSAASDDTVRRVVGAK